MIQSNTKVLIVSPWDRNGGLATYTDYLYSELTDLCEVSVKPWDHENIVHRGSGISLFDTNFIKSVNESDIVHVQYTFGRYLLSMLIFSVFCSVLRTPVIITQHEGFDNLPFPRLVYLWHQILYMFVDQIIVHTENRRSKISDLHQSKVVVVPHGVVNRPEVSQEPSDVNEILIPGIVRPIKGHTHLVRALSYLPEEISVSIAGSATDPNYAQTVRETALEAGVASRLSWDNRFLPESEMFEAIEKADLIVLPYEEHTSMSGILAHCMSWKTPTLITDCPSFRDVVNVDEAFLTGREPKRIAQSIRTADDPVVQKDIIGEFERLSEQYSWARVAKLTTEVYREKLLS